MRFSLTGLEGVKLRRQLLSLHAENTARGRIKVLRPRPCPSRPKDAKSSVHPSTFPVPLPPSLPRFPRSSNQPHTVPQHPYHLESFSLPTPSTRSSSGSSFHLPSGPASKASSLVEGCSPPVGICGVLGCERFERRQEVAERIWRGEGKVRWRWKRTKEEGRKEAEEGKSKVSFDGFREVEPRLKIKLDRWELH